MTPARSAPPSTGWRPGWKGRGGPAGSRRPRTAAPRHPARAAREEPPGPPAHQGPARPDGGPRGVRLCPPADLARWDIAAFARSFGLSGRAVRDVLHTLTTGVLFLPTEEFSAYAVFAPVWEGLKEGMTFRVGAFTGGMTEVMMRPLARPDEARKWRAERERY